MSSNNFITGLSSPQGIDVYQNTVYVCSGGSTIGTYNATTGAVINANFITGLSGVSQLSYANNVIYTSSYGGGVINTYNATTGALITNNFISISSPTGKRIIGSTLYTTVYGGGRISTYNSSTGALINSNYITGLASPSDLTINTANNYLYVVNAGTSSVGVYNASDSSTATTINTSFITGLSSPFSIVYFDNILYISCMGTNTIATYNATTGALINASFGTGLSGVWYIAANDTHLFAANQGSTRVSRFVLPTPVVVVIVPPIICFKKDTKILTDKGYKMIQDLRRGDLVKTLKNGYKPIHMIGKKDIQHTGCSERIKDQLYKCSKNRYPDLWEDLVITGCHSILVNSFASDMQRERAKEVNGEIYVTDGKYRLPACADERASVFPEAGTYTVYHFSLENDSSRENYGVYANGLLVESCSKEVLKELSNMKFIV